MTEIATTLDDDRRGAGPATAGRNSVTDDATQQRLPFHGVPGRRSLDRPPLGDADGEGDVPVPWRRPGFWYTAAATLTVMSAAAVWGFADDGAGALLGAGLLALLAIATLTVGAWTAGRAGGRNPAAEMMMAAAIGAPEGHFIVDRAGRRVHLDSSFRRQFAIGEDAGDPLAAVESALADDDATEAFARLCGSARAGLADVADLPVRVAGTLGGERIEWRRLSVTPVPGVPGAALWRSIDATAQREVDISRRHEEETLADILDNLPVGFFSADADGAILSMNQALADWLGVSAEEIHRKHRRFSDFVIAVDRGPVGFGDPEEGMLALHGPDLHGRVTLKGRGRGGRKGENFTAFLVQSQRVDEYGEFLYSRSVVLRDLLPARQVQSGRVLEERLRWLFDEAPVGIVQLDLHGNVTEANRAFLKLLGLHREAVIGRPLSERIAKEDRDDIAAQLSKVVMGTSRAAHLEVRMPVPSRSEVVTSAFASRIEDEDAEVSGLLLHFIDATEQKHLEMQFTQSQKMQAVGQLAGGVAHDFNNLLTAMIGFCDLLLDRHGPDDPSFADLMQIKQNANRATNLVRQLLAFSRKQKLQPVPMDLNESLSDMSNLLRRLLGEHLELVLEPGRDLGLVRADPGQFDQMVINLAVNARDAMPGGGTVTVKTANVDVDAPIERAAELMPAGRYVLVEVTDTGSGIPKENLGRIFEPFFSTKEVGQGTGLGLSTVYGIVKQSEGYIFVDSAVGQGSIFSIYLPRFAEASEAAGLAVHAGARAQPPADADLTGSGTVLLVEDEDAVRLFGARALRNKGYRVLEASNGEGALDVINASGEEIDLIISDMVMPGMDGHTLVRLVRHERPGVRIILMSGYTEDLYADEIDRDPGIHFLPKPFTLKGLAGKVKEVMGR